MIITSSQQKANLEERQAGQNSRGINLREE